MTEPNARRRRRRRLSPSSFLLPTPAELLVNEMGGTILTNRNSDPVMLTWSQSSKGSANESVGGEAAPAAGVAAADAVAKQTVLAAPPAQAVEAEQDGPAPAGLVNPETAAPAAEPAAVCETAPISVDPGAVYGELRQQMLCVQVYARQTELQTPLASPRQIGKASSPVVVLEGGPQAAPSSQQKHGFIQEPMSPPPLPDEEQRENEWHPKIDVLSPRKGDARPLDDEGIMLRTRALLQDRDMKLFSMSLARSSQASQLSL
ncbi:uncharacterized protein EMH_0066690 [Eimeria mitis]|uniref:Uncharacterized protein n=1 Tax=Eimeria mitis TaxID=44415 RepID=U6K534_9EIME|nr:uncharacterized protein EMH_0066690 [Eimeria mitis]CDJ31427.1 hypothetical protein, conserved [Eimeria mitis]